MYMIADETDLKHIFNMTSEFWPSRHPFAIKAAAAHLRVSGNVLPLNGSLFIVSETPLIVYDSHDVVYVPSWYLKSWVIDHTPRFLIVVVPTNHSKWHSYYFAVTINDLNANRSIAS